jgi:hypothetical protein
MKLANATNTNRKFGKPRDLLCALTSNKGPSEALSDRLLYGTAEAVPFVQGVFRSRLAWMTMPINPACCHSPRNALRLVE